MGSKTKVIITCDDHRNGCYSKDEVGYIDGYVQGGDGAPYACVVIGDRIELCSTIVLKVIKEGE